MIRRLLARFRPTPPLAEETIQVRGFVRVRLINAQTGEVEVDKEYRNAITAHGYQHYIVGAFGALPSSKQIAYMALASQTSPVAASQVSASGEFGGRKPTTNSFSGVGTFQGSTLWATNEGNGGVLSAIALYNVSAAGSCACIATFASSQKTTNQLMSIVYQVRFI